MPKMLQQLFLLIAIFAGAGGKKIDLPVLKCYEAGYSDGGVKVSNCPHNADGCYYAWDCGDLGKDIRGCSLKGEYACNKVHPDFNQSLKEACKGNCNECDQGKLCNRRSGYDGTTTDGGSTAGQSSTDGPGDRGGPHGSSGGGPGGGPDHGQDVPDYGSRRGPFGPDGSRGGSGGGQRGGTGGGPGGRGGPGYGPGGYPGSQRGGPDYGPYGNPYGGPELECYKSSQGRRKDQTSKTPEKCPSGAIGCFVALNCMRVGRDSMSVSDFRDCAISEDQCNMGYSEEPGLPAIPWKTMCSSCNVCQGDGCNEHDGSTGWASYLWSYWPFCS